MPASLESSEAVESRIFVHIGTHKTGSTAIQRFLWKNRDYLAAHGFSLYQGSMIEDNHIELHLACVRPNRDSPARRLAMKRSITVDERFAEAVRTRVGAFLSTNARRHVIFSSESLSLLRHEDEIHRLKRLLAADKATPTVILYLRNRRDFLASLRRQHARMGLELSDDPSSIFYLEDDSWRLDYVNLVRLYERAFGSDHIVVIDYDRELERLGNVVPAFVDAIGLPLEPGLKLSYFRNRTPERSGGGDRSDAVRRASDSDDVVGRRLGGRPEEPDVAHESS